MESRSSRDIPARPKQAPDEDLVRLYLTDVGKHPLLTRADESRLAQLIEKGRSVPWVSYTPPADTDVRPVLKRRD